MLKADARNATALRRRRWTQTPIPITGERPPKTDWQRSTGPHPGPSPAATIPTWEPSPPLAVGGQLPKRTSHAGLVAVPSDRLDIRDFLPGPDFADPTSLSGPLEHPPTV
jgi:hypothetical protein